MARFFLLFVQPRVVVIPPPPPPVKFIVLPLPPPPGQVSVWNVVTALSGTAVAIFSGIGLGHQRHLLMFENERRCREVRSAKREVLREKREVEEAGREVDREKREVEAHQILVQREKNRWWK